MENRSLVLEVKLAGDTDLRVISATRIQVDGRGRLLLYGTQGAAPANICLGELQSFSVRQASHLPAGTAA